MHTLRISKILMVENKLLKLLAAALVLLSPKRACLLKTDGYDIKTGN
jgi:hypothetical protein